MGIREVLTFITLSSLVGSTSLAVDDATLLPQSVTFDFTKCEYRTFDGTAALHQIANGERPSEPGKQKVEPAKKERYKMTCRYNSQKSSSLSQYFRCTTDPYDGSPVRSFDARWEYGYRAPRIVQEQEKGSADAFFTSCDRSDNTCSSVQTVYHCGMGCGMNVECTGHYSASK